MLCFQVFNEVLFNLSPGSTLRPRDSVITYHVLAGCYYCSIQNDKQPPNNLTELSFNNSDFLRPMRRLDELSTTWWTRWTLYKTSKARSNLQPTLSSEPTVILNKIAGNYSRQTDSSISSSSTVYSNDGQKWLTLTGEKQCNREYYQ